MSTEQQQQSALAAAGIVPTAVLQIPSLVDDTLSPSVQRALANFQRREQQQQTQTPAAAAAAVQSPPSRVVATVKKRARVEDEGSVEERAQRLVYCGAATNDALARLLHDAAAAKDASAPHADAAAAICTALDAVLRADAATMAALRESDPAMRELQRQLQHLGQADTVLDRLLRIYSALQLSDDDVRRWKIGPTVRRLSKKAATQELRAAAQELVIRWSVAPTQRQQQQSATPTRPRRRRRTVEDDDGSDEEASAEAAAAEEDDDEDETVEFDDGGSEEERGTAAAHSEHAPELQPPTEEEAAPKKKRAPEKHTSPKAQFLDLDFESQLAAGGAHSKRPSTGSVHATVFIDPFAEAVNEQIPSTKRTRIASISKKALSGDEIRKQRQKALENARREEEERRRAQLAPTSSSSPPPPTARVLSPSPPQPHENADSPPVLLPSAPAEPSATPSEPLAGSLTPGSAKRRTPKRVTWAPAQLLLKIREFERDEGDEGPHQFRSSDEARRAEAELEHKFMLEQKAAAEELWRKAKQDMQTTIAWRQPEVFRGAVKPPQLQSTEVETQKKRDESRLALMYYRPEMIPKTPKEPEEPQPACSISDVPVFPWNEPPPAPKPQPVQVPSSRGAAPLPDDIAKKLSAITPSILSQLTKSLGKPLATVAPPTAPAAPVRQQPLAPPPPPLAARAQAAPPPPSQQQQQQPTYAPVPAQITAQQYIQPSQPQQYAPRSIPQQVYAPPPPPPPQQQRPPPPTTYIQSAPQQYTYAQHQQPQVAPMAAARYGYWPTTTPTYVPQQQPQQQQYSQPPPVQYIQAQQYTAQQPQWQPQQQQQPSYQQWR